MKSQREGKRGHESKVEQEGGERKIRERKGREEWKGGREGGITAGTWKTNNYTTQLRPVLPT